MAWYAYCIAEQKAFLNGTRARRPFSIPSITGIAGTQVFGYPSGDFAVIVSNYTEGTLDQKAALDHARVVGECFRTSTVLPFRFGTVFQTEDAIRRAVRTNRKALMDSVNHLRGKAEMHLKLVVRDGVAKETIHAIAATIGGAYLTQIRERAAIQRDRQIEGEVAFSAGTSAVQSTGRRSELQKGGSGRPADRYRSLDR